MEILWPLWVTGPELHYPFSEDFFFSYVKYDFPKLQLSAVASGYTTCQNREKLDSDILVRSIQVLVSCCYVPLIPFLTTAQCSQLLLADCVLQGP